MELEHHCQAWPLDIVMPEDEASSGLEFVFEMEVTRICVHDFEGHSGNLQLDTVKRETFRRTFRVKHDDLSNESTATSTVSNMLYDLSFHPDIQVFMISKILDCASDMLRQKHYAGRKVLRMCVAIEVTHEEPDSVDAYVLGLPVDEQVYGLVPASKSAIEALEKMKIEDTNEACTVCLEDFHASAAARMPCLHLFHHKCIVNWLQTSNFCPLCRLELAGRE